MANVGIMGAGSWGTALALLLHKNGHQVTVWSISEEEVEMLSTKREHVSKLPGVKIPEDMVFTSDLEAAVKGRDFIVLAVPSPFTRSTARKMSPYIPEKQIIVDVAKGIEEDTLMTLSQQIEQEIPQADVAVLSGPSHAEEVGRGLPTSVVIGAKTKNTAEYLQNMFMNELLRAYTSPDILGMDLGGSLKNVIALAAGIADGLGYGDNTKAALITRGIAEIARLGVKAGGKLESYRAYRDRRSDRYLCQGRQREPESGLPGRTGDVHEGGYGRGEDGSRRRIFHEGSCEDGREIRCVSSDHRAGKPGAV